MRLFTGIALPQEILHSLEEVLRVLKPTATIKWSRAGNLHITTKFIGEWPATRLEELKAALREMPPREEIAIAVRNLDWFPNERSPRVLFAGIEAPQNLESLARETAEKLAELGVPVERRKYSPHLTLARIKTPKDLGALREAVGRMPRAEFGEFRVERFHLYSSDLRPAGAVYTSLEEYPLDGRGTKS